MKSQKIISTSKMQNSLICLICFLVLALTCMAVKSQTENQLMKWDYLVFTQDWPPATCYDPATQKCNMAENSSIWTIHGLWPDRNDGKDVQFCDKTWKFNITELEPIMDEMNLKWPSLVGTKGSKEFWRHEWEKHGTCAAQNTILDSMLKYFSTTLKLHDQFDMDLLMKKAGFTPNTKTIIDTEELLEKLAIVVGKNVSIECSKVDEIPTSVLSVVELYLDSDLQLIDSTKSGASNCKKSLVYWPLPMKPFAGDL